MRDGALGPTSVAEQAGLRTFDRILTINGTYVPDMGSLFQVLDRQSGSLELVVQRSEPIQVGSVSGQVPEVVKLKLDKQPGEGLAALV